MMQTTLLTLSPESEYGEAASVSELRQPTRTESNSSPSNAPVANDPPPPERPPSYEHIPPSLGQSEQPFVWAAEATQPLSNTTHSRQQHTFAYAMPYRPQTHLASPPNSIPVPPPYWEPRVLLLLKPSSERSHYDWHRITKWDRARLLKVSGAAHSALKLDAGPAPPEFSLTPAPAEQPVIDSVHSLPNAPPPPNEPAESILISTPYETHRYGIHASIGTAGPAHAGVIPIVARRQRRSTSKHSASCN